MNSPTDKVRPDIDALLSRLDPNAFEIDAEFRIVQNTHTLLYEIQYRETSCFAWIFGWRDSFKRFADLEQAKLCVQEIEADLKDRRLAQNAKRKVINF